MKACRTISLNLLGGKGSGAKVKTGCITRKIRHVKCDERKPECSRCTGTGRRCDGYTNETGRAVDATLLAIPARSLPPTDLS
ncbi:hypothetical protein BJ546DRAFT_725193 [Cryomyces antarcticus]